MGAAEGKTFEQPQHGRARNNWGRRSAHLCPLQPIRAWHQSDQLRHVGQGQQAQGGWKAWGQAQEGQVLQLWRGE